MNDLTKEDFNRFRERYDQWTFTEMREWMERIEQQYPQKPCYKDLPYHILTQCQQFSTCQVLELGGYDGSLAQHILSQCAQVNRWDNYDLIDLQHKQQCHDPRYRFHLLDRYLWEYPKEFFADYQIFVASHVFEHLSVEQIVLFLRKLPDHCWVLIEIPVPSNTPDWTNYIGTHLIKQGILELWDLFEREGFTVSLYENKCFILQKTPIKRKYAMHRYTDILPYHHPETPTNMDAWMTRKEIAILQDLVNGKKYCEIGTYDGFSAWMVKSLVDSAILIDPFDTDGRYLRTRKYVCDDPKIQLWRAKSQEIVHYLKDEQFDVLLIDGDHSAEAVTRDYHLFRPKVKLGGIILFHDYNFPGVHYTVDREVYDIYLGSCETLVWFQKKEP